MSGVTKQHQQACGSLNFYLFTCYGKRAGDQGEGTLMWQVQGTCGKRICKCKVLFVILSNFRQTVPARGGACVSRGGLARGVAVTVTGAVQG